MATINAGCRNRLTAEDFRFLEAARATTPSLPVTTLTTDESARDFALESDPVLRMVLELNEPVKISPFLYFYVLTRRSLVGFDRGIADYIAGVLAAFLHVAGMRAVPQRPKINSEYITDLMAALQSATSETAFLIRTHVGNYTLFISGIFPDYIQHRATRRGAPNITFYEEVGRANYLLASDHAIARKHCLADVYRTIASHFTEVRVGLNSLAEQLVFIEPAEFQN